MFESVELGRRVKKRAFAEEEPKLRTSLLTAQFALQNAGVPVVLVLAGVEGSGKGEVANRLAGWLDMRGVETHAFRIETDEERQRPRMWRYWRRLPPRGQIALCIRSWYGRPIFDHATGRIGDDGFDREMASIARFEELLAADGTLIVKVWLHLPKAAQTKRFDKLRRRSATRWRVNDDDLLRNRRYAEFSASAERAIQATDTAAAPWHVIEATQRRHRDLSVGRALLEAMQAVLRRLDDSAPSHPVSEVPVHPYEGGVLDQLDLSLEVDPDVYSDRLAELQASIGKLGWRADRRGRSTVVVFEGWDAAGKGGCIRRLTAALDARLYRVRSIGAPTDEEQSYPYLWRFWRHVPIPGRFTLYDRSWYGRVLVERVEGFATEAEWRRAYSEIRDFENQLLDAQVSIVKVFLHIDRDEQLRRFEERQRVPYKRHKITDDDWRNRARWPAYMAAIDEMINRTSTAAAPWTLIPATDKRHARLAVLEAVQSRLSADLA